MDRDTKKSDVDRTLLMRWFDGDTNAGDELTRRHYWGVHRFFELRAPRAAEDLTQRTFLACVENRRRFEELGNFRSFLFGIARYQLLRYLRKRHTRRRWVEQGNRDRAVSGPTPSGIVAMREEQRVLLVAISGLPIYLQMTLQLHYWEGLKAHEIADALGITTSAVTTRLARSRQLLRTSIAEHPKPTARDSLLVDLEGWARSLSGEPVPDSSSPPG